MKYQVCWVYYDDPFVSGLRFFDLLDKALEFLYYLSSAFFNDRLAVGLYLFEVGDDLLKCLMSHEIWPLVSDYKED